MLQRCAHISPKSFESVRDIFGDGKAKKGKVIKMKRRKAK